ncbi:hypothetical protein UIS43_14905 [Nocardiopsis sp. LDBS0036]|uniref:hypothetical protein n=1 Tax=Nocardiopsis sp. LDBS0036 TaxID=3104276 RepID=UPI00351293D1
MPSGFHSPGHPEDLPRPEVLWTLGTLRIALSAGFGPVWSEGHRVEDDGVLLLQDGGGNWWRMARVEGGRYLIIGWDRAGRTDSAFRPPVNPYADAPEWLPWEWISRLEGGVPVGFVYWWEDGTWARSTYHDQVDEDGVGMRLSAFVGPEEATHHLLALVNEVVSVTGGPRPDEGDDPFDDLGERLYTRVKHTVEGGAVDFGFLDPMPFDTAAATSVLRAAGVSGDGRPAAPLPAGREKPAERGRTRVLSDQEWSVLVESVMRTAAERPRPAPRETGPLRELGDLLRGLAAEHGGEVTYTITGGNSQSQSTLVDAGGNRIQQEPRGHHDYELRWVEGHPEHGTWFFLRARATPDAVEVDRAYDHRPEWSTESALGVGVWVGDVAAEMAGRTPEWRPEWVWLLDEETAYDPPADPFVRPA